MHVKISNVTVASGALIKPSSPQDQPNLTMELTTGEVVTFTGADVEAVVAAAFTSLNDTIRHAVLRVTDKTDCDADYCDGDYLITFQRKNHPGETYTVHLDHGYVEEAFVEVAKEAVDTAIYELTREPDEPEDAHGPYPDDLDFDPAMIYDCRRLTANDKRADVHADIYIG
jgi:hypothetical protein